MAAAADAAPLGLVRYNAHGVDGLCDRWNGGQRPTFTPQEQVEIVEIVPAGPDVEPTGLSIHPVRVYAQFELGSGSQAPELDSEQWPLWS